MPGARKDLTELVREAVRRGVAARVRGELRGVEQRSQNDPVAWGDPLYRAAAMSLLIYRGIDSQLSVHYGVHEDQSVVFVLSAKPVLSHPLDGSG